MQIHHDLNNFNANNTVLTVGTFDGVHLGHRKIIDRLCQISKQMNGESVIFTFHPHPRKIVSSNETNLRLLNTLDEKIALLEKSGIDHLIVFPFTPEFSKLSYSDFVSQILVNQIHTKYLVVGYDHKFGKDRRGDFDFLRNCADQFNFRIEKLDVLLMNDAHISSTKIREAIQQGNIETANQLLGYSFSIQGRVIEGNQIGRRINFPTANIETTDPDKIIPGYGVYAVKVKVMNQMFMGMLNIGSRPTVNHNADHRSIEVHILNFDHDIYDQEIELNFLEKLREEQKFPSVEELKLQLEKDQSATLEWFARQNL
jgi:riboflavin kinase/FMN adenylyltransferase